MKNNKINRKEDSTENRTCGPKAKVQVSDHYTTKVDVIGGDTSVHVQCTYKSLTNHTVLSRKMTTFQFFSFIFVVYINVHYTAIIVKHYESGTCDIHLFQDESRLFNHFSKQLRVKKQPRSLLNDIVRLESTITLNRNANHNLMAKLKNIKQ